MVLKNAFNALILAPLYILLTVLVYSGAHGNTERPKVSVRSHHISPSCTHSYTYPFNHFGTVCFENPNEITSMFTVLMYRFDYLNL